LGSLASPGPGFISFLSGLFLGTFSFILYLKALKEGKSDRSFWEENANKKEIFLTISALVIYSLLFEVLGFLASSVLFFLFMGRIITRKSWRLTISLSALASSTAYLMFDVWFKSQLPIGLFEKGLLWIFGRISF
jgi:hypothetical protein